MLISFQKKFSQKFAHYAGLALLALVLSCSGGGDGGSITGGGLSTVGGPVGGVGLPGDGTVGGAAAPDLVAGRPDPTCADGFCLLAVKATRTKIGIYKADTDLDPSAEQALWVNRELRGKVNLRYLVAAQFEGTDGSWIENLEDMFVRIVLRSDAKAGTVLRYQDFKITNAPITDANAWFNDLPIELGTRVEAYLYRRFEMKSVPDPVSGESEPRMVPIPPTGFSPDTLQAISEADYNTFKGDSGHVNFLGTALFNFFEKARDGVDLPLTGIDTIIP